VIRRSVTLLVVLALVASVAAARPALSAPGAGELQGIADTLTGPGMDGRRSGTPGGDLAARQIADWLTEAGLQGGGESGSFFQSFVVATGARIAPGTTLTSLTGGAPSLQPGRDWTPHGGSLRERVTGEIVFAGYGLSAPDAAYDDWAGVDARGRIALVLDGVPPHLTAQRSSRLDKLIAARRAGAAAVLIVAERLPALATTATAVRIVSGTVTPVAADVLLAATGTTTSTLARAIAARQAPVSSAAGARAELTVALESADRTAVNVVGVLPGTDPGHAGEAVVLGAHYDHLGVVGGTTYPGADDNASGTAVVVGLARAFAAAGPLDRTLVFALFGAEEIGLVGSGHYVRTPAVPIERTVAMLNFDMVGRLGGGTLTVGGVESGRGLRDVVSDAARSLGTSVTLRDSPYGPSDHNRFYTAGAPVLFFHTGSHADYHRPGDTADKLDAAGMARVAAVGARVAERLAAGARPIYVTLARPTGTPRERREAGAPAPAFLGVGVDGRSESDGLRLTHIVSDSAAARAGLREGDVLVRFDGRAIGAFEDLTASLRTHRQGDQVRALYLRDGLEHETSATLDARP
jgi:membrane-associated protease RseP (regulator of RpoE activity)